MAQAFTNFLRCILKLCLDRLCAISTLLVTIQIYASRNSQKITKLSQIFRNLRNISICNECSQVFHQSTCLQKVPDISELLRLQEESHSFSRNFSKNAFSSLLTRLQAKMHVIHAFGKVQSAEKASMKPHFQRQLDQLGPFRQHFAFRKLCVS